MLGEEKERWRSSSQIAVTVFAESDYYGKKWFIYQGFFYKTPLLWLTYHLLILHRSITPNSSSASTSYNVSALRSILCWKLRRHEYLKESIGNDRFVRSFRTETRPYVKTDVEYVRIGVELRQQAYVILNKWTIAKRHRRNCRKHPKWVLVKWMLVKLDSLCTVMSRRKIWQ